MSAQILGVVLSFASVDGQELALTVSLSEPSAAVLEWGDKTQTSEESARILTFRGLPVPVREPVRYELRVPGLAPLIETVEPPVLDGKVRAALYGDNRDGPGPHAIIVAQMARAHPSVIVHTGDVVRMMEDEEGWDSYLATTFPLARRVPTILALGNHELSSMRQHSSVARTKILSHVPTAFDAIASELETPRGVFHVRVGPAVFISLDSNSDFGRFPSIVGARAAPRKPIDWSRASAPSRNLPRTPESASPKRDSSASLLVRKLFDVASTYAASSTLVLP